MIIKKNTKSLNLFLVFLFICSCITQEKNYEYGQQKDFIAYIPAQTALLPCMKWPNKARYKGLRLTNASGETISQFCKDIDQYIMKSFKNQPYVKGYSPKAVQKMLIKNQKPLFIDQLKDIWSIKTQSKSISKQTPLSIYIKNISTTPNWKLWLNELSNMTKYSDAVLIPFIVYAQGKKFDDRGLLIARREIGINLFLIDTSSGEIIWASNRTVKSQNQNLKINPSIKSPEYPEWAILNKKLLVNSLWIDFPGRQEY